MKYRIMYNGSYYRIQKKYEWIPKWFWLKDWVRGEPFSFYNKKFAEEMIESLQSIDEYEINQWRKCK